ncbi:hypothetical protein ID866_8933 [Astraeus odoratus]|nr:hypothetical protein ID866_8933 [Astraeus odoratus]
MSPTATRRDDGHPEQQVQYNDRPLRLRGGCIPCPGGWCFIIPCPCC